MRWSSNGVTEMSISVPVRTRFFRTCSAERSEDCLSHAHSLVSNKDSAMNNQKFMKRLWAVIAVMTLISMIGFTAAAYR